MNSKPTKPTRAAERARLAKLEGGFQKLPLITSAVYAPRDVTREVKAGWRDRYPALHGYLIRWYYGATVRAGGTTTEAAVVVVRRLEQPDEIDATDEEAYEYSEGDEPTEEGASETDQDAADLARVGDVLQKIAADPKRVVRPPTSPGNWRGEPLASELHPHVGTATGTMRVAEVTGVRMEVEAPPPPPIMGLGEAADAIEAMRTKDLRA